MKTLRQFLTEGAFERKLKRGDKLDVSGAEVIYHDPAQNLTVYHALTPDGLKKLCSGMYNCTTNGGSWRHAFLRKGNMFIATRKKSRMQIFFHVLSATRFEAQDNKANRYYGNYPRDVEAVKKFVGPVAWEIMTTAPHRSADVPEWSEKDAEEEFKRYQRYARGEIGEDEI